MFRSFLLSHASPLSFAKYPIVKTVCAPEKKPKPMAAKIICFAESLFI